MKTITFLTPLYFSDESCLGGGERWPLNMAMGLVESAADFRVELISFGPRSFTRELHPRVLLRVLTAAPSVHPLDQLSWELPSVLASVDVVHLMQCFTRTAEIGAGLAMLLNKSLCATDLGGWSSPLGPDFGLLHLTDLVVCYSDFGAALLPAGGKRVVIKGGVDSHTFRPPLERPTRDRVLFVGRFLPHKGVDRLIRALPPDLPLTCCGRPYNADYFDQLRRLAVGKRVEFVTDASDADLRRLYAHAWANVLPSTYLDCYGNTYQAPELMGLTLLEAMACGTPAVCARVGAMPEFVRHGETGFVFDTEEELTAQLHTLAADPALCDRMGDRAREVVVSEYDLRVCGSQLAAVYRKLLGIAESDRRVA